jgi:hypothetical protein
MTKAEVLAASDELGAGFEEAEVDILGAVQYRAFADRVTVRDLVVGPGAPVLEMPESLAAYSVQDGRVCRVEVIPMAEGGCVLDGVAVGRDLMRSGFRTSDGRSFDGELQREEARWRERRAADPEERIGTFDLVLVRSDGTARLSLRPTPEGPPCLTRVEVSTCRRDLQ